MIQLDYKFLEDIGLGAMSDDKKNMFLDYLREQLQTRVGVKLSKGLSKEVLDDFESFIDRDEARVNKWLLDNVPDYRNDNIYKKILESVPTETPELDVNLEYASVKWLNINCPNYRDVVMETIQELRDEAIANRDAILES